MSYRGSVSFRRRLTSISVAAVAALAAVASTAGAAVTPFNFVTHASANPNNPNTGLGGDLRLDSIDINNANYLPSQLQTVNGATIVVNNGVDPRGGHILASGRGIGAASDNWAPEGPATVDPISTDLQGSQANFNLSSIVVTREVLGTTFVDYNFASPTDTFLYWERGRDSDATFEALDTNHNVVETFKILRQNENATGYFISTENGAFNITSQQLGSIGLKLSEPVSEITIASHQFIAGGGPIVNGDDGPDYKVLAFAASTGPAVPEPMTGSLLLVGILTTLFRRREPRRPLERHSPSRYR